MPEAISFKVFRQIPQETKKLKKNSIELAFEKCALQVPRGATLSSYPSPPSLTLAAASASAFFITQKPLYHQ